MMSRVQTLYHLRCAAQVHTKKRYIPAEEIPSRYGGFKRDGDLEFFASTVSEAIVKPGSSETIEILVPEVGGTLIWEVTVDGWEVNYKEEFVPGDEGSYTVIVQKGKKIGSNEGPIRNSFRNNELGKQDHSYHRQCLRQEEESSVPVREQDRILFIRVWIYTFFFGVRGTLLLFLSFFALGGKLFAVLTHIC